MKIVGISCSPRKGKTTRTSLDNCIRAITENFPKIQTENIKSAVKDLFGYHFSLPGWAESLKYIFLKTFKGGLSACL